LVDFCTVEKGMNTLHNRCKIYDFVLLVFKCGNRSGMSFNVCLFNFIRVFLDKSSGRKSWSDF